MSSSRLLAAAILLAFVAWQRRSGRPVPAVACGLVAAGLAAYAALPASALPDFEALVADATRSLGSGTYLLAGALVFLETATLLGLILPGEVTLVFAGAAAAQGDITLTVLLALVVVAAIAGDATGFAAGRWKGRAFLLDTGGRFGLSEATLERVEGYLRRYGGWTVFAGRFVGVVRSISPAVVGASGFTFLRFLPFSAAGAALWSATFTVLGYLFWDSLDVILERSTQVLLVLGAIAAVAVVGWMLTRRRARKARARRRDPAGVAA